MEQPAAIALPVVPATTVSEPEAVVKPVAAPIKVTGKLLSASDGEQQFQAHPEARRLLAFTDEGLFIAFGKRTDMYVLDYIERLRRKGVGHRVYEVSIEAITSAYKSHSLGDGRHHVDMGGSTNVANEQYKVLQMLQEALNEDASDIHFITGKDGCDVRYRVMGSLETRHGFTRDYGMSLVSSLFNSMTDVAESSFNPGSSQKARLNPSYTEALGLYGARVQTRPTHDGLIMVCRLLKADDRILTHKELGFLDVQIELMRELAAMPYGVTLISGPTGSGKSRTLQATMNMQLKMEDYGIHVVTIENPPEYPILGAVVTPLIAANPNDPDAVSHAWRDSVSEAMRLDPDVIMVGEVSDLGSAKTCFSAAKTGHGVWSTLHANDSTSIPKRLIDMNVAADDVLDPGLLVGLTAQRLVPKLCPSCKIPLAMGRQRLRKSTYERLLSVTDPDMLTKIYVKGDGCEKCRKRGIVGRVPVIEIVRTDVEFMAAYASNDAQSALRARRHWVQNMGGITMLRHALHLVWNGQVDPGHAEDVRPLDTDLKTLGVDYARQDQLV